MDIKKRFLDWFNNYPYEALDYSEGELKYLSLSGDMSILEKKNIEKTEITSDKNYLMNLGIDSIKFYFIDLEKIAENKEKEKQVIKWKLKNTVLNISEEDYDFEYTMINKTKALVLLIMKLEIQRVKEKFNTENLVFNLDIIGVYNYYKDSIKDQDNRILIVVFKNITYLIFIHNGKIDSIRFFRMGVEEYFKAENISGCIEDSLKKLSKTEHIPDSMESLFEQENFDSFEKVKKINQKWMMSIETEIKEEIAKEDYQNYEIMLGGYENTVQNIDILLEEYIGIKTGKTNVETDLIPYIAVLGNLYKWHKI